MADIPGCSPIANPTGFTRRVADIEPERVANKYSFHYFSATTMNRPLRLLIVSALLHLSGPLCISAQTAAVLSDAAFTTPWFINLFSVMALAVIGIYNCVIFIMHPKDRAPLYFGIFCVFIAVNNFVSSAEVSFLTDLFPHSGNLPLRKMDIATIILSIPFFIMFMQAFFPESDTVIFKRVSQSIAAVFLAAATVSSGKLPELVFTGYFPVILISIGYCVYLGIRAMLRKRPDSRGVFIGIVVMSAAGINDVLWGYGVQKSGIIMPYATLVFALIYSVLISRRFANALTSAERLNAELLENQRLRSEMQQRIAGEQQMRQSQRRLTAMLHTVDSPLCATDSNSTIVFCNRAFEEAVSHPLGELIGKEPSQFDKNGTPSTVIPLDIEDEQLNVHLYESQGNGPAPNRSVVGFIEELNKNRARIRSLELLLTGTNPQTIQSNRDLRHDLEMIDTALEQIGTLLVHDGAIETRKQQGAEVMALSVAYWSECMHTDKFALAEESGFWKVQINPDGWKRTQTLDRYLDYKTFPQNPRWNRIVETADFVLIRCQNPSDRRRQLELALQKLCLLLQ